MIRHVTIRGRVQGVGYRAWTADEARKRGIEGWVRNRHDDSVEAVFSSDADTINAMIVACRNGPALARVTDIVLLVGSADELALRGFQTFAVLPTV